MDSPHRQRILVVWYNDYTYSFDHAVFKWPGYNNPGSYTVEVNAGAGGADPPKDGWIVVDSLRGNSLHSREHLLTFAGYNWLRLNFSAADGSPQNMDISGKVDIYEGNDAIDKGWLFAGDSITANAMGHSNLGGVTADSFGNQVARLTGDVPIEENAGMPGWLAGTAIPYLPIWLKAFPGKYVTLNFGTNDASGVPAKEYYSNMSTLVQLVLSVGKVPVIPTIPWASRPDLVASIPALNGEIRRLLANIPCIVPGPDLYAYFNTNRLLISGDGIHPTDAGLAALRGLWADTAARISPPAACVQTSKF